MVQKLQKKNLEDKGVNFLDALMSLFSRKILILTLTTLVTALGVLYVNQITPTYISDEKKTFTIFLFFTAGFMLSILTAITLNLLQRTNENMTI